MKFNCLMLVFLVGILACAGVSTTSAAQTNQQTEIVMPYDMPADQAVIVTIACAYSDKVIVPSIQVRRAVLQNMYDSKVMKNHDQYCRSNC